MGLNVQVCRLDFLKGGDLADQYFILKRLLILFTAAESGDCSEHAKAHRDRDQCASDWYSAQTGRTFTATKSHGGGRKGEISEWRRAHHSSVKVRRLDCVIFLSGYLLHKKVT